MPGFQKSLSPKNLADRLFTTLGESVFACYQCGKCTAGCPLSAEMDLAPNQILLCLQAENPDQDDVVLRSRSIWLCLACETCHSRCPKEVNLPAIVDFMRQESVRQGKPHPEARDIVSFHEAFLDSIRANGRLHEVGLIAGYKFKTFHMLQDVLLAPRMLRRGKLG
ncbi:MAG TPA: 4Fe-4S dicluster domain-containing protein, partial [Phycisphaerae bacterium]|nr:4Fe-4S dicluster domain-containing protein [Phycisphaerae bacterium]